jgi:hypothetical protein
MNETLRSARNLMETSDLDAIQAGGPSSSNQLNVQLEAARADLAELDRRTSETEAELDLASLIFANQNAALVSFLSSLDSQLPAVSGTWLADFYVEDYFDGTSTAELSTLYGQVTLPVLRTQENLVGLDAREQIWVPKTTRVGYATVSGTPVESDWLFDDRAVHALDGRPDTAWWRDRPTSQTVWVRVQAPSNLNANKESNCILLHAWPSLAMHLKKLEYRNPAGTWAEADLSYLVGWDAGTSKLKNIGNLRIWIPPTQVTEFRFQLDLSGSNAQRWGFSQLGLQWVEFQPTATLVATFADLNPPALTEVTVLGQDPDSLAYLTTQIIGPQVSVALTQVSHGTTPVITAVEVSA